MEGTSEVGIRIDEMSGPFSHKPLTNSGLWPCCKETEAGERGAGLMLLDCPPVQVFQKQVQMMVISQLHRLIQTDQLSE